jgi:TatD DNase family protein
MQLVDTHCHLDASAFDKDRDAVIVRAVEAGVSHVVIPGVDAASSRAAVELAAAHPSVYAAAGIHPNAAAGFRENHLEAIEAIARAEKVVAIGEIGLDYYRDHTPHATQRSAFEAQLALAVDLKLPVIIHNRESSDDLLDILARWAHLLPSPPGVMHAFSAGPEVAERALELGFFLGFAGPVTYKKADRLRQIAAGAPADRIVVETDAPYLTPHPYRGKRNEPAYVRHTAERLAVVRDTTLKQIAKRTTANAGALFGW